MQENHLTSESLKDENSTSENFDAKDITAKIAAEARKDFARECLTLIAVEKEKGYSAKDIFDDVEDFLNKELYL